MDNIQKHLAKIRNLLDITFFRILLFILLGLILYISLYPHVKPEKLDLKLYSIAPETIRSPITVSDKESTEKKKDQAEAQVQDVYVLKTEITENRVDLIRSIFDAAIDVNREAENAGDKEEERTLPLGVDEKLDMLKNKLTKEVAGSISDSTLRTLVSETNENLSIARDITVTAINNVMRNRIPADEVQNKKKLVEEEIKYATLNSPLSAAAVELGRFAIVQNEFFDVEATQQLKQEARERVEPVKILQGQIIVEENELIDQEKYHQLQLAGLLDNKTSYFPFIGLLFLTLLILGALYYNFYEMNVKKEVKQTYLLLFSIIFIITMLLMKVLTFVETIRFSEISYIFPAAMGAMLIKILIGDRLALLWTVIIGICGSLFFNDGVTGSLDYHTGIYFMVSGIAAVLYLNKQNQRSKILRAGLFISVVNALVIFSFVFIKNGQFGLVDLAVYLGSAFVSGIAAAVLTIGLLPFFESGFGILSTMKLIELSNPNHPLLRKILTEAPGTYHHSIMVANLAEAACEAIGANGLLARVGSYYHDIGKTKRPQFFIENQINMENPHDRLPPETSKNIIIDHVTDGVEILRKYGMPKEIVNIAEQHHGTTLLKFFYYKALEAGGSVDEKDFRYPGPKAQTKEIAVIGIADSVEAAVRSMKNPDPEKIESLVRKIISDRLQDGQLNNCEITLKELEIVANTLCETLKGIFHSRIEYPEIISQKVKRA